ncbi:MAG: DEAD/DEAH box helicase [Alphaproteobacteria bacterium]|nr:DEAD/DEAH box helicase [Alphaproteobacteria bacterium]
MTSFEDLGLGSDVLKAIAEKGYTTPTPIQEKAIPIILMGRDMIGCAQTGTGKTGSFTIPLIEILGSGRARARMPRSIILEPTRELAAQVEEHFRLYGKYHKLETVLLIGGENMDPQIKKLDRGVDVLIATPGRMIDLFERGRIMLNDIKIFVIDESDRMLDMGFIPDIEKIAGLLPKIRQTLLFSATMPPEIRKLAQRFMSSPKEVSVSPPATTATTVKQAIINVHEGDKRAALRTLLRHEDVQNAFIFCNRKRDIDALRDSLRRHGFNVGALHGDLPQSKRTETLDAFRKNEISLLVCSDVAARGIDIGGLSHVFNFDVPFNAEDYVHRIGRTGRAGKTGIAYMLVTSDEREQLDSIEKLIKKKIEALEIDISEEKSKQQGGKSHRGGRDRHGARPGSNRGGDRGNRGHEKPRQPEAPKHDKPRAERPQNDGGDTKEGFGSDLPAFLRRR